MVADESVDGAWVEISSARLVRRSAIEHFVDPNHQCVRTSNDSPFMSDSVFEPLVAFPEIPTVWFAPRPTPSESSGNCRAWFHRI
jgi:hypothetical protein